MTVVSRQTLVDSRFPTVVCAPVFTRGHGLETEISVGPEDGLKHPSWIASDGLVSIPKSRLTDFVGALPASKRALLSRALCAALDLF
jgi:mRNA interferase MazF